MSARILALYAGLATCLFAGSALADLTITHQGAGFCFDVPDGWKSAVDEEDPNLLMVTSPEDGISIQTYPLEAEDLEAAIDGLVEGLEEQFDDVKLNEEVEEANINDLDRVILHGTATLEGEPVLLAIVIVIAEKPVLFLAMGAPEAVQEHQELLGNISKSIRKAE